MRSKEAIYYIATDGYLPHLRVAIKSARKFFNKDLDIHVGWLGSTLPIGFDERIYFHQPDINTWTVDFDEPRLTVLASRPLLALHLLRGLGYQQVMHLGADVVFYNQGDWLFKQSANYDGAITPHSRAPYPQDMRRPNELQLIQTGLYNSDLVIFNNTPKTERFLQWQKGKHEAAFGVDLAKGYFYDQNWLNFFPLYTNAKVIKDCGVNAAYYNLHERRLQKIRQSAYWLSDLSNPATSSLLTCFQFTGYDPRYPSQLSKYLTRQEHQSVDIVNLCLDYYSRLLEAGWQEQQ